MVWHSVVGTFGVACFLVAYFQLQQDRWSAHGLPYLGANLLGSILVLVSLAIDWNFAAFMLEVLWALISMYGIVKTLKKRNPR